MYNYLFICLICQKLCNGLLTVVTFDCLAASNWPPGHPRSDHHVSNPHRPDYYWIQAGREDPQCSEDRSQALTWIQQQNKKTAYE